MRRALLGVGVSALAMVMFAGPASAGCPADGSIPGGGPSVITLGTGGTSQTTFYIDDRDYADLDDDNKADGIWIYQEYNKQSGLQRGGDQFVLAGLPGQSPKINPISTGPLPTRPNGITLFPNGFGGENWSSTLGFHDDCVQSTTPDRVWF